jgi:hypothetical protein
VLVMVQVHGLLVDMRFQRIVSVRQRGDFVCHFDHLSFVIVDEVEQGLSPAFKARKNSGLGP